LLDQRADLLDEPCFILLVIFARLFILNVLLNK
jgi:hypothetical protein